MDANLGDSEGSNWSDDFDINDDNEESDDNESDDEESDYNESDDEKSDNEDHEESDNEDNEESDNEDNEESDNEDNEESETREENKNSSIRSVKKELIRAIALLKNVSSNINEKINNILIIPPLSPTLTTSIHSPSLTTHKSQKNTRCKAKGFGISKLSPYISNRIEHTLINYLNETKLDKSLKWKRFEGKFPDLQLHG